MKTYVSTQVWQDLTDMHLYREGEPFPFDGRDVPADRLEALESGRNRAGLRLIRAIEAPDDKPEARKEEAPETAKEPQKTPTKKPRAAKKK